MARKPALQRWQASGLTQAEFVRVHQLKCTTFVSWLRRSHLESADPLSDHGRFIWPQSKKNKRQDGGAVQWAFKKALVMNEGFLRAVLAVYSPIAPCSIRRSSSCAVGVNGCRCDKNCRLAAAHE
ncbi:IS66 family insertion sequence element accessory protein TnpA [Deefgea piscis]|uniref:IS66 family insertion sequence element accessory protein TnpA n=1 Tax=Deefgea piscis TaxID=2739061 RepID=UPI00402B1A32